jgi:hypothetical protein
MNIFNIKVPKDEISMIFDPIRDAENYSTSLYLHKSKIAFDEENNIYTAHVEIDSNKSSRTDKLVKQIINCDYGTFLTTILNADFSTAEKAYYSFFVYYGIEGTTSVSLLNETNPTLYATRYISTKKFLDYYDKTYTLIKEKYIDFQSKLREIVDYVYNLHQFENIKNIDKYAKLMAYSCYIGITEYVKSRMEFSIVPNYDKDNKQMKNLKQVEKIANKIADGLSDIGVLNVYSSKSHLAQAYMALIDLVKYGKRNISVCQNCGRYYLQYSGKEIYCDLPNSDGSPSCKSFASRKAYDERVTEDIAELTYKREYQRRITQVYRAVSEQKEETRANFKIWKSKAREQLKLYRENKITSEEFCEWIEKNK